MTKPYTVLLLRPDYMTDNYGQDTYQAWVWGDSIHDAICAAQEDALGKDSVGVDIADRPPRDDYHVLAIYEGHHYNRAGI